MPKSTPPQKNEVAEAILQLAFATRAIAHGPTSGPTGLEALGMMLRDHFPASLDGIAQGLGHVAEAIDGHPASLRDQFAMKAFELMLARSDPAPRPPRGMVEPRASRPAHVEAHRR